MASERRCSAAVAKFEGAGCDFAVEANLRASGGIAVGQGDEVFRRGADLSADGDVAAFGGEAPGGMGRRPRGSVGVRAVVAVVPQGRRDCAEAVILAFVAEGERGQPRASQGTEVDLGCGEFEHGVRMVFEADALTPGVAVRVLNAPVVVFSKN